MTSATVNSPNGTVPTRNRAPLFIQLLTIWHVITAVGSLVGLGILATNSELALWIRIVASVVLAAVAIGSVTAVIFIRQRNHKGRVISLAINYLGFLFCLLGGMHTLNMFTGLDGLADNFGRGIPFVILFFIGFYVSSYGERFEGDLDLQNRYRQIGRYINIISAVVFLFAVGILSGLGSLLSGLTNLTSLALVIGVVLFGLMGWAMWHRDTAEAFNATNAHGEMLDGYLFLSPNLLGFLIFFAGPLVLSLYVSFTNSDAFGNSEWIGLANYLEIFNLKFASLLPPINWPTKCWMSPFTANSTDLRFLATASSSALKTSCSGLRSATR